MNKLRIALIGCGRISYKHIEALVENSDEIKLIAVSDIFSEKAVARANQYSKGIYDKAEWPDGCEDNAYVPGATIPPVVYKDYKELLDQEEIDAVSICTESGYHAEIAIYCMKKGKHVIVEKPMALSVEDADLMIRIAEERHVKLCVSHQNRFNPPIQKLRQAIETERFGKIIGGTARILWNRNQGYYSQAPWRGTYEFDGGCLMNQCIHNIDLLQWMLGGNVESVNGVVRNCMHDYIEAEDYGSVQVEFSGGIIGNIEGTVCVFPENLEETLTIFGEKGTVAIGGLAVNKIEVWRFCDGLENEADVVKSCSNEIDTVYGNGHAVLYKDFIDSVRNDRKPYIDGSDGKIAMQIILAAYKSSREKRRVNWSECGSLKSTDGGVKS